MGRYIHACAAAALLASAIFALRTGSAQEGMGRITQHHDEPAPDRIEAPSPVEPTLPGQDAFGAVQEIVQILEADPKTDWSKVNLEALRQHLIDMNEVTLKSVIFVKPIDGGLEFVVAGNGRTIEAIQHIVMAHARFIQRTHLNGWAVRAGTLPDGVLIRATSDNQREAQHIRGLGLIGILASGHHDRSHHLALARGERGR